MSRTRLILVCLALLPARPTTLQAETASDTLVRRNGLRTEQVIITADEYTKVVFSIPGGPDGGQMVSNFPADHVVAVIYGDEPLSFNSARTFLERGKHQKALEKFAESSGEKARPWLQVYVPFGMAECERNLGKYPEALRDYQKVLDTAPKSRLVPSTLEGMALTYLAMGGDQFAKALEAYEKLESGEYGPRWKLLGSLGKGLARESEALSFLASGNQALHESRLEEALKIYEGIMDTMEKSADFKDENYKEILFRAKTRKGKVLSTQGRRDEAVQWFSQLIQGAREARKGLAEAYNGRADCFFAAKEHQRALWDYLRVATVYFHESGQHQYALKRCVECFNQAGDKKRAAEYVNLYKQNYPDSGSEPKVEIVQGGGAGEGNGGGSAGAASSGRPQIVLSADTTVHLGEKVVGNAKKGETYVISDDRGEWVQITLADGKSGWIKKSLGQIRQAGEPGEAGGGTAEPIEVKTPEPVPAGKGTVTVVTDKAKVFSGSAEVAQVKQGETYPVLEERRGWYRIEVTAGGKKILGWISAKDVKLSP
ncbi:MAG: tetratricopeptide repeat protein [Planctomycetes bacterium]|nr:tetratricopeptide repeat protein [Planctomycetota bacterium]